MCLFRIDNDANALSQINLAQGIQWLVSAWSNVSIEAITNAFRHCGYFKAKNPLNDLPDFELMFQNDQAYVCYAEFNTLAEKYKQLSFDSIDKLSFNDYVEYDKNLSTYKKGDCNTSPLKLPVQPLGDLDFSTLDVNLEDFAVDDLNGMHSSSNEEDLSFDETVESESLSSESESDESTPAPCDTKMRKIDMIRHIGDLKLFAAQRSPKDYSNRLLATINQLEKQLFEEPKASDTPNTTTNNRTNTRSKSQNVSQNGTSKRRRSKR